MYHMLLSVIKSFVTVFSVDLMSLLATFVCFITSYESVHFSSVTLFMFHTVL